MRRERPGRQGLVSQDLTWSRSAGCLFYFMAGFHSEAPAHLELTQTASAASPVLGAGAIGMCHLVTSVSVFRFAFTRQPRQAYSKASSGLRFLSTGTPGCPALVYLLWDIKGGDLGPVGACLGTVTNSILDIPHHYLLFYIYPSEKAFTTVKQHISLSLQLSREKSNDMAKSFLNS